MMNHMLPILHFKRNLLKKKKQNIKLKKKFFFLRKGNYIVDIYIYIYILPGSILSAFYPQNTEEERVKRATLCLLTPLSLNQKTHLWMHQNGLQIRRWTRVVWSLQDKDMSFSFLWGSLHPKAKGIAISISLKWTKRCKTKRLRLSGF